MKAIVVGCGKFGVRVSEYLTRKNYDVVVIDNNSETFHALSEEFTGQTLCGVGYDKDILDRSGIATADVVIGCTGSDSLNTVVASIAKNVFYVPTVIARMYDPIRAKMFESMGIYTVSITRLGLENIKEHLEENKSWRVMHKFGNDAQLIKVRIPITLEGTKYSDLEVDGKMKLVALERQGNSLIPEQDTCCEYNDILYLSVRTDYLKQAMDILQL